MGACYNDEQRRFNFSATYDRRFSKHVRDNVYGNINLDPLCLKFIDTEQFQRLRDLKQLGVANLVYPGAVHSRFEHSLGVYWLADAAVRQILNHQGLELGIDQFDVQTVRLAGNNYALSCSWVIHTSSVSVIFHSIGVHLGLLHDVGHGPFSHTFEREFLPRVLNGSKWYRL